MLIPAKAYFCTFDGEIIIHLCTSDFIIFLCLCLPSSCLVCFWKHSLAIHHPPPHAHISQSLVSLSGEALTYALGAISAVWESTGVSRRKPGNSSKGLLGEPRELSFRIVTTDQEGPQPGQCRMRHGGSGAFEGQRLNPTQRASAAPTAPGVDNLRRRQQRR